MVRSQLAFPSGGKVARALRRAEMRGRPFHSAANLTPHQSYALRLRTASPRWEAKGRNSLSPTARAQSARAVGLRGVYS